MTETTGTTAPPITDDEVAAFVARHLAENGLATGDTVVPATSLADLGLDSIALAGMLLSARAELVAAGRLSPDATVTTLPPLDRVRDLADLLRGLAGG